MQGATAAKGEIVWGAVTTGRDVAVPQRSFETAVKEIGAEQGVKVELDPKTKQILFDTDDPKKIATIVMALESEFGPSFE